MLVHKSTPVAYQDNRVNLGLIFNIAFFFFFFSEGVWCWIVHVESRMNSQGIVQATKAGIKFHLTVYLQSMPAIVRLVNTHGLFAFYPMLIPSLLSLKNVNVSVLVDL